MECKLIYRIILIYLFVTKTLPPKKFPQFFGFLIFGDPFQKKLIKKLHFSFLQKQNTFSKPRFLRFCRKVAEKLQKSCGNSLFDNIKTKWIDILDGFDNIKTKWIDIITKIYNIFGGSCNSEKSRFALLTGLRPVFR